MTDDPVRELGTEESWQELRRASLGRLALCVAGEIDIFPINFVVDADNVIYLRTAPGTKLLELSINDHVALEIERLLGQRRIQNEIKQQLESHRGLIRWDQHVEVNIIKTRCSVAAAPQGFNGSVEFTGAKTLAALEHHVFQKVSHSLLPRSFRGASSTAPEIQAHQRCIWHFRRNTMHAIRQRPMGQLRAGEGGDQNCVAKFHSVPSS